MSREILKRALDALKKYDAPSIDIAGRYCRRPIDDRLCNDIMKALAQPDAEPVAYAQNPKEGFWCWCNADEPGAIPLFATPQAQPAPAPVVPDERAAFMAWVESNLPHGAQINVREAMARDESLSWRIWQARAMIAAAPAVPAVPCWCETCRPITLADMRMVLCPTCGNKRCPHATDHRNACTNSNEPGQVGSSYANCAPAVPAVPDWASHLLTAMERLRHLTPLDIGETWEDQYAGIVSEIESLAAPAPSDKMGQGRLILEAASGMHGDVAKQLTAIYTDLMNSLAAPAVPDERVNARVDAIAADRDYWRERFLESAVQPLTDEQRIAIREAHCNTASDEYFGARPQVDDATKRRIYEAGFKEGWESGITQGGEHG
jgi:hypothetical protein